MSCPACATKCPVLIERLQTDIAPWLQAKGIPVMLDSASIKAFVLQTFSTSFDDGFKQALTSLRIGGSVALAVIGNLVLIPVVLFYLLVDWQRLVRHVEALVPMPARGAYDSFVSECDEVLGQYLRGQLSVMALLAVYYSVALWAFGLELAFPDWRVHRLGGVCALCGLWRGFGFGHFGGCAAVCAQRGFADGGGGVWLGPAH